MKIGGKLFAIIAVGVLSQGVGMPALAVDISGAGSTFAFPILAKWADAYKKATGLSINYQSIGSVSGIWLIKSGRIDFGVSDAPLRPDELVAAAILQFPIVIGGVVPVVNLRGIGPGQLRLTGPVLADIYLGKIANWNDKAITELNPDIALPDQAIVPVHRAGDSGTRYIFADYLAKVSPEWRRSAGVNSLVQVRGVIGSRGNELVAAFTATTRGAIGYVEYAYAKQNNLTYVLLQNHDGQFVAPNNQTFKSAAANADWSKAQAFHILLTDQPGKQSWPISGATFVLAYKNQQKSEAAAEMLKFFDWAYRNGMTLADDLGYVPIPQNVVQLVEDTWAEIKMPDGRPAWVGATTIQR